MHLEYAGLERLLGDVCLGAPVAVLVAYPHVPLAHGQVGACIFEQCDRLLLAVAYHAPCLYHIAVVVGAVAHIHVEVIGFVLHRNGIYGGVRLLGLLVGLIYQFGAHVAVGMPHAQCGDEVIAQAEGGICLLPQAEGAVNFLGIGHLVAIVADVQWLVVLCLEQKSGSGGVHEDVLGWQRSGCQQGQDSELFSHCLVVLC